MHRPNRRANSTAIDSRLKKSLSAKVAAWLLFATVAGAPLPFGSDDPATIAVWCLILGVALILVPVDGLVTGHFFLLGFGGVIIAAYGFVLHEQVSLHPWLPIATPHPIWAEAEKILGGHPEPLVSIARNEPIFALGSALVAMLSLATGLAVGADRVRARQLLWVIAWSGAGFAAFGILQHLTDPTKILWREKHAYLGALTSTFINRNTAAIYFGTCSIVWLLLLAEQLRSQRTTRRVGWREVAERMISRPPRDMTISLAMLFMCLIAMFMTGSRAGVVLSLLVLVVTFSFYFRRRLSEGGGFTAAAIGGGVIVLILLQFLGEFVANRFAALGADDEGRLQTYLATLRMISDHPWLGTGQGTFALAFPGYRSSEVSMWGVWDIAHNTLLEIAADMGIPIAALVAVGWIVIFATLSRGIRLRHRDLIVPTTALAVGILAILHSMIDFSLQIPGYAIVALALIGTGLAQSFSNRNGRLHHSATALTAEGVGGQESRSAPQI